jgi:hypothetical protein
MENLPITKIDPPSLPLPGIAANVVVEAPKRTRVRRPVNELTALTRLGGLLQGLGEADRGEVLAFLSRPLTPAVAAAIQSCERVLGHLTPESRAKVIGFLSTSESVKAGA